MILKFLSIASQVEKAALTRPAARAAAGLALDRLVDDLWLARAEIDLAAGDERLRGAAYRFATRLAEAARGEIADAPALRGPQVRFMDAAYDDLWPGRRRAAGDSLTPR
ncbi:hypothetical protein [Streptomyces sp. NPDC014894]|uniref:hypothetical protein n=1 Tax=Streptomyces sp. NPDC014894 TaxID=3364931 RepID=UPI0036FEF4A3